MSNMGGLLLPLLLLLLVGFMFYSQRRRQKSVQDLQSSISVGDEICTTSGLFGTVTEMDTLTMHLEIAPGTVVKFDRRAVALTVDQGPAATTTEAGGVSLHKPDPASGAPASPIDEK